MTSLIIYNVIIHVFVAHRGDSSARGRRVWAGGVEPIEGTAGSSSRTEGSGDGPATKSSGDGSWCTVYVGNLAYKVRSFILHHIIYLLTFIPRK